MPTDVPLPPEVEAEAGAMFAELRKAGWRVRKATYDENCFGNWIVELVRARTSIRVIKDRSYYEVDGPDDRAAGLFRAFKSLELFRRTLVAWAAPRPRA